MNVDHAIERFRFACRDCGVIWSRSYEVRRWEQDDGTIFEVFSQYGLRVLGPHSGVSCPSCRGVHVTVDEHHTLLPLQEPGPTSPPTAPARPPMAPRVHRFP